MIRVLIITYYWPPAGGPGVQRWLKFVKYFRKFGIDPIVFAPENPNYPLIDHNLDNEIPSDIEIIKFPIKEPYRLAKLFSKKKTKQISSGIISKKKIGAIEKMMLYVRGNFFIPDARIGWVKPSVEFLSKYISENRVDVIITTGPPHSLHLIGKKLKENLGLKWIADFRDPWTTIHYHKSLRLNKTSEIKHKHLEAAVLQAADQIVATSPTTQKEFKAITKKPIEVITNGYDISEEIKFTLDKSFSISHIGSLLSERNPEILWQILSDICNNNSSFKNDLELKFAGAVSDEAKHSLEKYGLIENCVFLGYVSHLEALKLQNQSQVLLLVEIDSPETQAIIPGKIFEYLAAKRPIIAIGPKGSDIKEILEETESGKFFDWNGHSLRNTILQYYKKFQKDELIVFSKDIEKYSRMELTRQMATLVKAVVEKQ
ncbi:MAG TPA: glycosyltransferase family 4 protein [Aequorivita sp.]|nr:glycosyltransferase family 4 protein [Aequorivita sp.]